MAKLVLFRHGETEWNAKGLLTGQAEVDLTDAGREQAKDAGWWLRHIKFDSVHSSSMMRAMETTHLSLAASAPINDHLYSEENENWIFQIHEGLRERNIGDFSGQPNSSEIFRSWPKAYDVKIKGGESTKEMVDRVDEIYREHIRPVLLDNKNVLVVAHAGIMIAFKVILGYYTTEQAPQPKERVPNAVPWVIEFDEEGSNTKDYLLMEG